MIGDLLPYVGRIAELAYKITHNEEDPAWLQGTVKVLDGIALTANLVAGALSWAFVVVSFFTGAIMSVVDMIKGPLMHLVAAFTGVEGDSALLEIDHRNWVLQYGTPQQVIDECNHEAVDTTIAC